MAFLNFGQGVLLASKVNLQIFEVEEEEEGVEEGEVSRSHTIGFMATRRSFGSTTSYAIIQARRHLQGIDHELFRAKNEWKKRHGVKDVGDTPMKEEDVEVEKAKTLKELLGNKENAEVRKNFNEALASMWEEQVEINKVDAILGEEERESY